MAICFVFYAEIQDECQKWWENDFWQKMADDSVYTLQVKSHGSPYLGSMAVSSRLVIHDHWTS